MQVYQTLSRLGIDFVRADHAPAFTMEDCQAIEQALGCPVPKNLFLCNRQQTDFYLVIMPADKPFKTKDLSHQLGCSRLSFGPEEPLWEYLRIRPGAVSPLGLLHDGARRVRFLADRDLEAQEYLAFHPCRNTSTVRISLRNLLDRFLPDTGHEVTRITL